MTVKITDQQFARLAAEAKARGISRSALIRDTLESTSNRTAQPSLLERLDDIVGSVEGPADLSTARKYLKGYGLARTDRHRTTRRDH